MRVHGEIVDLIFYAKLLYVLNHKSKLFNVAELGNTYLRRDKLSSTLEYDTKVSNNTIIIEKEKSKKIRLMKY